MRNIKDFTAKTRRGAN